MTMHRASSILALALFVWSSSTTAGARQTEVRPYDWRETTGIPKQPPPVPGTVELEATEARPLSRSDIEALLERERRAREVDGAPPTESPFASQEEFAHEAETIAKRAEEARAARSEREAQAIAAASDPSSELIDAGGRLDRVGDEVANKVALVAKAVSILLFLVALLLWYSGIFTTGQFSNPITLFSRAAIAFVLLVGTPTIMAALGDLGTGAAKTIDATFSYSDGETGASAIQEVYRKIGMGIEKHWEDYNAQTLRADDSAGDFVQTSWRLATMFYLIFRAIWDFLWVALRIVAPLSAVAFMINAEFGGRVFATWLRNVLNVACWPIGWSIVFGLMNAGVDDWARTDPGTLYQIAFLCYMLALLVVSIPALVTMFWNGEGVAAMLGNFGTGMADSFLRTGIASTGGAIPSLGLGSDAMGSLAMQSWDQATALGSVGARAHMPWLAGRGARGGTGHGAGETPTGMQAGLVGLFAMSRGNTELGARLMKGAGLPVDSEAATEPSADGAKVEDSNSSRARYEENGEEGRRPGPAANESASRPSPTPQRAVESAPSAESPAPADTSIGSVAKVATRWGLDVSPVDFGRSLTDTRGASVRDANGQRVYIGDVARIDGERSGISNGAFVGHVTGFQKSEDGDRVPVLVGHDVDANGAPEGREREIVVTNWKAEPGTKLPPREPLDLVDAPPPAPPALGRPDAERGGRPYI